MAFVEIGSPFAAVQLGFAMFREMSRAMFQRTVRAKVCGVAGAATKHGVARALATARMALVDRANLFRAVSPGPSRNTRTPTGRDTLILGCHCDMSRGRGCSGVEAFPVTTAWDEVLGENGPRLWVSANGLDTSAGAMLELTGTAHAMRREEREVTPTLTAFFIACALPITDLAVVDRTPLLFAGDATPTGMTETTLAHYMASPRLDQASQEAVSDVFETLAMATAGYVIFAIMEAPRLDVPPPGSESGSQASKPAASAVWV